MRMLQPVSGDSSKQSIANYSSRPALSQLKGVSDNILNSYENHQPQTTQISSIINAPFIQNSHRIASRLTATASFPSVSWKAGPVTCVWLANQIRGFRILARSDAWEKNKCFFIIFPQNEHFELLHCPTLKSTQKWTPLFSHRKTPWNTAREQQNRDWPPFQSSEEM